MFFHKDARGQRFGGVARQHRHGGLRDDRAAIQFGHDEMHRAAGNLHARVERLLMHADARETRAATTDGC